MYLGHATSSTVRTKSTGVGIEALDAVGNGDANTAFGYRAMTANTTGYSNTAVGTEALRDVVSGLRNTAIGIKALETTVEGSENIAIGRKTMNGLLTASKNIAIGNEAATSSTTAENQIIIGHQATGQGDNYAVIGNADVTRVYAAQDAGATLYAGGLNIGGTAVTSTAAELNLLDGASAGSNTTFGSGVLANVVEGSSTGNENVAIGYNALANNTTGYENTVVGYEAGYNATNSAIMVDKQRVTAIGFKAGKSNKGGNNSFIGHSANKQASSQSGSNATAIGYQATVAGSNAIQLGNSSVTSLTVGDGGTGVTIYAGQIAQASDERLKKLIKPLVSYGLSYINKLNPVTWSWKSDDSMDAGFIAQEVQQLGKDSKDPYGLIRTFNNPYTDEETLTMDYGKLVVPLVKAVQELSDEIERLKSEIKDLESKLEN